MALLHTEAFVLSKLDYSESSIIARLFTLELGKLSVIVKGGRRKNSREGKLIDPLNKVTVSLYTKESREIQTLSSCDLTAHYPGMRNDYTVMMCAFGVLELVNAFIHEHEVNELVFRGVDKIFHRFEQQNENPLITLSRFFVFILQTAGFEITPEQCTQCGREIEPTEKRYLDYRDGIICTGCRESGTGKSVIDRELFFYLDCLKKGKALTYEVPGAVITGVLRMLEIYARHHSEEFKGLQILLMR